MTSPEFNVAGEPYAQPCRRFPASSCERQPIKAGPQSLFRPMIALLVLAELARESLSSCLVDVQTRTGICMANLGSRCLCSQTASDMVTAQYFRASFVV